MIVTVQCTRTYVDYVRTYSCTSKVSGVHRTYLLVCVIAYMYVDELYS